MSVAASPPGGKPTLERMAVANSRRGFISTAAGVGVFAVGASATVRAAGPIGDSDVLVAMPGERYYAIPPAALEQFAVNPQAFEAEESRRATGGTRAKSVDIQTQSTRTPPPPPPPPPPRNRSAAMGIRG